jgi:large subunit ribosomal protein L13
VRTFTPKASDRKANWYVIDATDVVLGRLASQAATLLRGKHKTTFAPHIDMGDFVIIINAEKVALSGSKLTQKFAHRHSGFPGGLTSVVYGDLVNENPAAIVEKAVLGMIPKNKLGRQVGTKLKVYAGSEHPHAAQNPVAFQITQVSQIVK